MTVTSVEEPLALEEMPKAAPGGRSPLPFSVFFSSPGEVTLIVGVGVEREGPLPVALDKGVSLGPVVGSPSNPPMSFSLSFPFFLDFLEGCWPMKRALVVGGAGECDLDFERLLENTEKRELASLWR